MSEPLSHDQRICLLGANGQVGLEVCLFLSEWERVKVTPVCRTQYGSALLRRLGLECRHGRLADEGQAGGLMAGASLVVDFGWPGNPLGKLQEIRRQIRHAIRHAPAGVPYVFISTQSVYCLDPSCSRFSIYRLSKRYAERVAWREGRKAGRPVFVLRLGEVHGPLQRVSRGIVSGFRSETARVPSLNSYTVFTYSIAEALVNIALGRETPGTYTVMSAPEWRWPEVHAYYARWVGLPSLAVEEPVHAAGTNLLARCLGAFKGLVRAEVFWRKDAIEYWGTRLFPLNTQRLRIRHYRRQAAEEIGSLLQGKIWRPYGQKLPVPGRRLTCMKDVRPIIFERNQQLLRRIEAASSGS